MNRAQEIEEVVKNLAGAWNRRDWSGFGRPFTEEANYITADGVRLAGRERIVNNLSIRTKSSLESGTVVVAAALAEEYRFDDIDGKTPRPLSIEDV